MRRFAATACAVLLAAATVPSLRAQQTTNRPDALADGRHSLVFSVPDGGGTRFGYWVMTSERTNLGISVGLNVDRSTVDQRGADPSWRWSVSVTPALKRYIGRWGPVVPYAYGALGGGHAGGDRPDGGREFRTWNVRGSGGIGVEWFPVDRISIGGHMGAQFLYVRRKTADIGTDAVILSEMNSGLRLHVYFGGPEDPAAARTP